MMGMKSRKKAAAPPPPDPDAFWRRKSLAEMTPAEWESLCDGCGRCCLLKLEDEETGEIAYTNVACRLLNIGACQCSHYAERNKHVPDCVQLDASNAGELVWMPRSCAYRRLAEGANLAWWHPLVSGDPDSVHQAGVSVRGRCVPEGKAGDLFDHVVSDFD